jgi:hypothetical protein
VQVYLFISIDTHVIGGCEGGKSRLTEAQKERRALTQKIELIELRVDMC